MLYNKIITEGLQSSLPLLNWSFWKAVQSYKLSNLLSFSKKTLLQTFSPWFVRHLPEIMYAKHRQQETPCPLPKEKSSPPPSRKKRERTPPPPRQCCSLLIKVKRNNIELTRKVIDKQFSKTFEDIQLTPGVANRTFGNRT